MWVGAVMGCWRPTVRMMTTASTFPSNKRILHSFSPKRTEVCRSLNSRFNFAILLWDDRRRSSRIRIPSLLLCALCRPCTFVPLFFFLLLFFLLRFPFYMHRMERELEAAANSRFSIPPRPRHPHRPLPLLFFFVL